MHFNRPALLINEYKSVSFKRGKILSATPILRFENAAIEVYPDTDDALEALDYKLEYIIVTAKDYITASVTEMPANASDIQIDNIKGVIFSKDTSRVSVIYSPSIKTFIATCFHDKKCSKVYAIGLKDLEAAKLTLYLKRSKQGFYVYKSEAENIELPTLLHKHFAEYNDVYGSIMLNGLFYNSILFSWKDFIMYIQPFFNGRKNILYFQLTSDKLLEYITAYTHIFFDAFPVDIMSFAKHISNHEKIYSKEGIHLLHGTFFERFDIYLPDKKIYKDLGTKGIELKLKK